MKNFWWLEVVGYLLAVMGGWRILWRIPMLLGLMGANKLGTAKGSQVEENKGNIEAMKKGIPFALVLLIVGLALIFIF